MALLAALHAPLAPTRSIRSITRSSRQVTTAAQWQQRQRPASAAAAARQGAVAAAALGSSLGTSPAALAAADNVAAVAAADPQAAQLLADLALLDAQSAGVLSTILKPALSLASLLMIVRIVMSWYPELDGKQMPWAIAYTPTGALPARPAGPFDAAAAPAPSQPKPGWPAACCSSCPGRAACARHHERRLPVVVCLACAAQCTQHACWAPPTQAGLSPRPAAAAEPVLRATRKLVPPFNGLDVSPIVWVALLSFLSEILTGPQGILSLIQRGAKLL